MLSGVYGGKVNRGDEAHAWRLTRNGVAAGAAEKGENYEGMKNEMTRKLKKLPLKRCAGMQLRRKLYGAWLNTMKRRNAALSQQQGKA